MTIIIIIFIIMVVLTKTFGRSTTGRVQSAAHAKSLLFGFSFVLQFFYIPSIFIYAYECICMCVWVCVCVCSFIFLLNYLVFYVGILLLPSGNAAKAPYG